MERKIEIRFDEDKDGRPVAIIYGNASTELYINTINSVKDGMDNEEGEGNYTIIDLVKVYPM